MATDLRIACVSQFKLNETSGTTVIDNQGFSNGTSQRDCSLLTTTGKINAALSFNGTSDYIDLNNSFRSIFQNSFSLCLWVFPSIASTGSHIGRYEDTGDDIYIDQFKISSKVKFEYQYKVGGNFFYYSPTSVDIATWYFLVLTATKVSDSQATFNAYLNNSLKRTQTITISMGDFSLTDNIWLGNNSISSPYWFTGDIDDVMIFNKALSEDEIAFLWNDGDGTEELWDGITEESTIMDDILSQCWAW